MPSDFISFFDCMSQSDFSKQLLAWYNLHRRVLPWRTTKDPYFIWLSEIILQQTRVIQGLPYYERFIDVYPTVTHLAKANEQDILRLWQGLGYYKRAQNLHQCAQYIVTKHNGKFPNTFQDLCELPGIGPYTAAAIASIAFDEPVATLDGNVYRVLTRVFGIQDNINLHQTQKRCRALAQALLDRNRPGDYNQALMEFGALHCTPVQPKCDLCIFKKICIAYRKNQQSYLPVKKRLKKIRTRYFYYFVIQHQDQVFMKKRSAKDIWKGLYDFYLIEGKRLCEIDDLEDELLMQVKISGVMIKKHWKLYRHQLTHQRIYATFFMIKANQQLLEQLTNTNLIPYAYDTIQELPMPILLVNFWRQVHLTNLQPPLAFN